jgi:hypothetical protein
MSAASHFMFIDFLDVLLITRRLGKVKAMQT